MTGLWNVAAVMLCVAVAVSGFSLEVSRREAFKAALTGVAGIATVAAPSLLSTMPAFAVVSEETPRIVTRMGGLLVSRIILNDTARNKTVVFSKFELDFSQKQADCVSLVGSVPRWGSVHQNDGTVGME
jgi:cytochrome c biogenesis protein CcdA